jgi:hypothetical protein
MSEIAGDIEWTENLEQYFKSMGERCYGLAWLHKQSEARYARLRNYTDLPVIILGVLNAAASVGSGTLFSDPKWASVGVGVVALVGSIISAVSSYFKWAARAESHRIASIQYGKLNRWVSVQMRLPRGERLPAIECLKYCKQEFDRLQEITPLTPPEVIATFQSKFGGDKYMNVSKPTEANGLEAIEVFKEPEVSETQERRPTLTFPLPSVTSHEDRE